MQRAHPDLDRLLEDPAPEEVRAHLADCARCRVERRRARIALHAEAATLPGLEQARGRLQQARQAASLTLSDSLHQSALDPLIEPEIGGMLGGYRVEELLGRGAMGSVYLVRDEVTGGTFALKWMNDASEAARERLSREAWAQLRIQHPNVVSARERLVLGGYPALLMDHVPGPDLDQWLCERDEVSMAVADAFVQGILRGLAAIHAAGLTHRDLKPGNVLLHPDPDAPGGFVPRITDFGLVAAHAPDTEADAGRRLTRTGMSLGTPSYMSPEHIRDAHRADTRSDLFSLGAIAYELYAARRAFPGKDLLDIFSRVKASRFTPLAEVRPEVPPHHAALIEACLAADATARPATAQAVLDAWTAGDLHTP